MKFVGVYQISGSLLFYSNLPLLKRISAEFQVIRGFSQKMADLLSYDKIHS